MAHTVLSGPYRILNLSHLTQKAEKVHDPRHVFYEALLRSSTYEAYLAKVGSKLLDIPGFKKSPVSGRTEILYCRRKRWIADGA